jgi:hypothetical protein
MFESCRDRQPKQLLTLRWLLTVSSELGNRWGNAGTLLPGHLRGGSSLLAATVLAERNISLSRLGIQSWSK